MRPLGLEFEEEPINQCDGCQKGLPTRVELNPITGKEESHHNGHTLCTKDRYVATNPQYGSHSDTQSELESWEIDLDTEKIREFVREKVEEAYRDGARDAIEKILKKDIKCLTCDISIFSEIHTAAEELGFINQKEN